MQTVERVFGLDEPYVAKDYENPVSKDDDKVSEQSEAPSEIENVILEPISLEEIRREARENWLRLRQRTVCDTKEIGHTRDADRSAKEDHNHSIEDDKDE